MYVFREMDMHVAISIMPNSQIPHRDGYNCTTS